MSDTLYPHEQFVAYLRWEWHYPTSFWFSIFCMLFSFVMLIEQIINIAFFNYWMVFDHVTTFKGMDAIIFGFDVLSVLLMALMVYSIVTYSLSLARR
jgi:hypothetical protein